MPRSPRRWSCQSSVPMPARWAAISTPWFTSRRPARRPASTARAARRSRRRASVLLRSIPGNGPASATVPGLLRAVADLLARFGSRDLSALMRPAIRLAEEGFVVHRQLAANTAERAELLAKTPARARYSCPAASRWRKARALPSRISRRFCCEIAEHGVDAFYHGEIAARMAASCAKIGGLLTTEDFATHRSLWQAPIAAPVLWLRSLDHAAQFLRRDAVVSVVGARGRQDRGYRSEQPRLRVARTRASRFARLRSATQRLSPMRRR